jgi:23S rRNA-/tRNA-specific pseudouridylate synthase
MAVIVFCCGINNKERHMISLAAADGDSGKELFDFLFEKYPEADERVMINAFKKGNIALNGNEAYGDDEVHAGDSISLFMTGDVLGASLKPEILFQDENFIIADKPAGLLSISDSDEPNAVQMLEEEMKQRGEYSLKALIVPYLVYPLERYVSGLLILAKHEDAYRFLVQALMQRRITRYFICPVIGQAKDKDELLAYHLMDRSNRSVRILSSLQKKTKPIVTRYTAISSGEHMTLLSARPITNYLHQIRAHLAFEGLPVVGDNIYGNRRFNKRCGAEQIALWLKTVIFETGTNHSYAYLNGRKFESKSCSFPKCIYDAGLNEEDLL